MCFILGAALAAVFVVRAEDSSIPPAKVVVRADSRSGRLVRSVVTRSQPRAGIRVAELVDEAARRNNVDPLLVHSVIQVESNYNPYAISPKGAEGLMQLVPSTARRYGARDSFNAKENIEAGVKYLKHLQETYPDLRLALAAYNAGERAVAKFGSIPPYPETQSYVQQVGKRYGDARRSAEEAAQPQPDAAPAAQSEDQHPRLEQFVDEQGRIYLRTK